MRLAVVHEEVDARAASVRAQKPDWPCREGCDACCRRLAEVPRLSPHEWELLDRGLSALPLEVRRAIDARVSALAAQVASPEPPRHLTCPMLDEEHGACLVYAHRPVACRTYGFYVEHEAVLGCELVAAVAREDDARDVVWGDQRAIDRELVRCSGEPRSLLEWSRDD